VSEKLGLSELKDRQWSIHKCCATKGEGLEKGLDW
jgi:ADP-ribosylation factor-like protein 1